MVYRGEDMRPVPLLVNRRSGDRPVLQGVIRPFLSCVGIILGPGAVTNPRLGF
jgi:hypothetical protein